jgi:PTH1 family peptidyl-tRNA hydrolase
MILIGLRNKEEKYKKTRHNAGAIVLEYLAKESGREFENDKYVNADKSGNMYLPNTFMNLSGESVQKIVKKENIDTKDLYVFFDDATIPVGQFKISVGEGASSHNGIKSIIESLGGKNDFKRVRIGVGKILDNGKLYEPGPDKFSDFVLGNLNNLEIAQIQSLANDIIKNL